MKKNFFKIALEVFIDYSVNRQKFLENLTTKSIDKKLLDSVIDLWCVVTVYVH